MAKVTLDIDYDLDFILIGISCHLKDYRLVWALNQNLGIGLRKTDEYEARVTKGIEISGFSQYEFDDPELMRSYNLISNRGSFGHLIPEQKQADYLLIVKGNFGDADIHELINTIHSIDFILTVFEMDVHSLKSKNNLIF